MATSVLAAKPSNPQAPAMPPQHLLTLADWTRNDILFVLDQADRIKAFPNMYGDALKQKTLLMIFAKPSLRTRLSFEVGMTQLGGHAIYYDLAKSPMGGQGKETIADTATVAGRMVDIIMARLFEHEQLVEIAAHAGVPVINALTNYAHPCQILADLQTIREKKGSLQGLKLAYYGDANNNVTHSLLFGCAQVGIDLAIACPPGAEYEPQPHVLKRTEQFAADSGSSVALVHDALEAAVDADVIYTDSWMSYHIPPEEKDARVAVFSPFQVTATVMKTAKPDAIFLNCLPALRGMEQTAEVIDGPQSVVFDEAENRLHAQKAVLLYLTGKL